MTFAEDIEAVAQKEPILQIIIGTYGWGGYSKEKILVPDEKKGVLLSWTEARKFLDYDYDSGYGSPKCHAITAWTPNKVIFVGTYDYGSTWVTSVPRNPVKHEPDMIGGG